MATALVAGLAGCGDSEKEPPELIREDTLTLRMPDDPNAGPLGFHQEVLTDAAKRLGWEVIYAPVEKGKETELLVARRADAAAPAPIRRLTTETLAYTAPYYEDPRTGTLYGVSVLGPESDDNELLEDLDEALALITDDGTLQKVYDKWFPGTEVPDGVLNDASD